MKKFILLAIAAFIAGGAVGTILGLLLPDRSGISILGMVAALFAFVGALFGGLSSSSMFATPEQQKATEANAAYPYVVIQRETVINNPEHHGALETLWEKAAKRDEHAKLGWGLVIVAAGITLGIQVAEIVAPPQDCITACCQEDQP